MPNTRNGVFRTRYVSSLVAKTLDPKTKEEPHSKKTSGGDESAGFARPQSRQNPIRFSNRFRILRSSRHSEAKRFDVQAKLQISVGERKDKMRSWRSSGISLKASAISSDTM
ncbi:hypothetical protein F2Q69_00002558 [Brassica cretica]|uniref:Uncharacterized protein n=1 Tax=Brassica cretica TaxID=69181 RepID=A0A8S9P6K0_BRACR|nr:hypothetical protein F2Q69_00002558 [Brassica cretica]